MRKRKIGGVNYNNALTIIISPEGFYIKTWAPFRFGHLPLLIPWRDIYNVSREKVFWLEMARFEVSRPPFGRFRVRKKVMDEARQFLEPDAWA